MQLPALQLGWQLAANASAGDSSGATTDHQLTMLGIKDSLVSFATKPWTVHSSSDSSAVDTSDLWGSETDIVWATGAHSWIVLDHPVRDTQICIDCTSTGGTVQQIGVYWSPGGLYTGGSTTAKPTATDEIDTPGADFVWFANISAAFQSTIQVLHSYDGKNTRVLGIQHTSAKTALLMLFEEPIATPDLWETPEIVGVTAAATTSADGCGDISHAFDTTMAWIWATQYATAFGLRLVSCGYTDSSAYDELSDQTAGEQPNSLDYLEPYALGPIMIAGEDGGYEGVHGRLRDIWTGPTNLAKGSTYPNNTAQRVLWQAEDLVLPWTGDSTLPKMQFSPVSNPVDGHELGAGWDTVGPIVNNQSPADGTVVPAADPVYFDVTDDSGLVSDVTIWVRQGDVGKYPSEVVYDGTAFLYPYGDLSAISNIANGYRVKVRRSGGWLDAVYVTVKPLDSHGNMSS